MPTGHYDRSARAAERSEKLCPACEEIKPVSHFHRNRSAIDGRQAYCSDCRARQKYEDRKNATVKWHRKKYGITPDEYAAMLFSQGGVCAICGGGPKGNRWGQFCVDHDHLTGRVRGLLCGMCNLGLGRFRDDPDLLNRAADYLNRGGRELAHGIGETVG